MRVHFAEASACIVVVVVYLYLTSAKCTGIAAFSLWPEATALTEMVKVELHERKKMKFYNYIGVSRHYIQTQRQVIMRYLLEHENFWSYR